jgi:hypothetical protein
MPDKKLCFIMLAWIAADSYMLSVELPPTMTSFLPLAGPIIFENSPKVEEQMGDSSNLQNIPSDAEDQTGASSNLQNTPTTL